MNWFSAFASPLRFEEKKENKLGRGAFGVVYRGTFKGNAVAVKVIVKVQLDDEKNKKREIEEHFRLDHENVLKLLHVDDSPDKSHKTYLVLELCAGTLTDYCEKKYNGPALPLDGRVLYQIANGLHYIHSRNLVHRDVKPDNILISITTPVQMKLSDFGYVKKTSPRGTFTQQSGLKGTLNWMAPEMLELLNDSRDSTSEEIPHGTIQSDTFAAGCVFVYFLTRGKHPFGSNSLTIPINILNKNPIELNQHVQNLKQSDDRALYELIGEMINPIGQRISLPEVIIQLTAKLYASRQFKRVARLVRERYGNIVSRFHPKEPVLACGTEDEIIFFSAENSSIPFSNWKRDENTFQIGHLKGITRMEWNAEGTQLAAVSREGDVIVWDYPSGAISFQQKILNELMNQIEWNPFRPNLFATFRRLDKKVFLFNSRPDDQRPFHFYTIKREKWISSVQWISANRVALGLRGDGRIEIWEIDESTTSAKIVKRLEHEDGKGSIYNMAWNERTECLATCSWDGWMKIWSMDSDQPIHATKVDGECWRLAWRPNGKQSDGEGVEAARKSADNFILACGLDYGKIVIWTPLENEKTRILSQHSDRVDWLSFSPDGRFLASADINGKLIIWATENWKPVYIGEKYIRGEHFSWSSFSSTDVPDYKLIFPNNGQVVVVEHVDGQ